mmetsp:Transcript_144553/g.277375  ORF Transcript_144553/g.277375 Transcript_144553/m.277375 type:complete len:679 (-) Transcript_144553:51-2087(-)
MFDLDELEDLDPSPDAEELARETAKSTAEGLKDKAWNIRRKACRDLGALGAAAAPYLEALKELTETDDDFEVRKAARNSLKALQDAGVKLQKDARRADLMRNELQEQARAVEDESSTSATSATTASPSVPAVALAPPTVLLQTPQPPPKVTCFAAGGAGLMTSSPKVTTNAAEEANALPQSSPKAGCRARGAFSALTRTADEKESQTTPQKLPTAASSALRGCTHTESTPNPSTTMDPLERLAELRSSLHGGSGQRKPKESWAKDAEPLKPSQPAKVITVNVVSQLGSQVPFKVKTSTPLQKVISTYCNKFDFDITKVQPSVKGVPLFLEDTAEALEMEDEDPINVIDPVNGEYEQSSAYPQNFQDAPANLLDGASGTAAEFLPGQQVTLIGLERSPELNGAQGTIVEASDDRWLVDVDNVGERRLKSANLSKVTRDYQRSGELPDGDEVRVRSCYEERDRVWTEVEPLPEVKEVEPAGFAHRNLEEVQEPVMEDDSAWAGLVLRFQIHSAVLTMRIDKESVTPAEVAEIWEKQWNIKYADRVKFIAQCEGASKHLRVKEDVVPPRPELTRLEGPPGVLMSLKTSMFRFHGLTAPEVLAKQEEDKAKAATVKVVQQRAPLWQRPKPQTQAPVEQPGGSDMRARVAKVREQREQMEARRRQAQAPARRHHPGVPQMRPL